MRKIVTIILASLIVGSTPALAVESEANANPLPKVLTDLGFTQEDFQDIGTPITDEVTSEELDIMRRGDSRNRDHGGHRDRDHRGGRGRDHSGDWDRDHRGDWGRGPGYRYCRRGYHLESYRVRVGRYIIVRYRCVRNHYRHWDSQTQSTQQQSTSEQDLQ